MLIWLNVHLLQIRNQFCWLNFLICFSMSFNWNFTCYFTWFHVIYNQFGTHYSIIFNCTLPNSNAFSRLTCSDYLKLLPAGATPVAPADRQISVTRILSLELLTLACGEFRLFAVVNLLCYLLLYRFSIARLGHIVSYETSNQIWMHSHDYSVTLCLRRA